MYLTRKWNEIMGPKDERLEVEESRALKAGANILLAGAVLSLYYAIMLDQVAYTTNHPILTPLGESIVPVSLPLTLTILTAGAVSVSMQTKSGFFSSRKRLAEVDRIPWDYVTVFALFCGCALGILTCAMRIVAEIQIVGIGEVAWFGDLAIGAVFFVMGFAIGFAVIALAIHGAIKRRREIEREMDE